MRCLLWVLRGFVGVIFVISGLIKLNDPLGFSFKLEEYFSPAVFNLPSLVPLALAMALFIVVLEVLLGVALLLGFYVRETLYALLGLLIFFGGLTFYSAYYDKVTDCGCFGDAINLTPWQSFAKDMILLFFVLILFFFFKNIKPLLSRKREKIVLGLALGGCIFLGGYVLRHLPAIDFRPYRLGTNLYKSMQVPEHMPQDIYRYVWRFEKNGKTNEIINTGDYPEEAGSFVDVSTSLVKKGYEPPIHDFTAMKGGVNHIESLLKEPLLLMIVIYNENETSEEELSQIPNIVGKGKKSSYKTIILLASSSEEKSFLRQKYLEGVEVYYSDRTTLKTIIRSNPGIVRLKGGLVVQKLHYNDFDELKLD